MRTDKEQFDLITENYEKKTGEVRRRRKILTIVLSAVLAVALLVSSVVVLPGLFRKNGPTDDPTAGTDPSFPFVPADRKDGSEEYYITDHGKKEKAEFEPVPADEPAEGGFAYKGELGGLSDGMVVSDRTADAFPIPAPTPTPTPGVDPVYEDPGVLPGGYEGDQTQYAAGTLTGAELLDRLYYEEYVKSMAELLSKTPDIGRFDFNAMNRIKVKVTNGSAPLSLVKVELFCENSQEPVFTSITDNKGEASVFYNKRAGEEDLPSHIVYTSSNGVGTVNVRTGDKIDEYLELELGGENKPVKLDLMFMIDTTGSMGDELEYIKTEIRDIIAKIVGTEGLDVRTSVNFYRDKGDEYIVHATPFTSDPEEVYEYIRKEHAMGGGDTPEAVHTALDNAINGHEWDEDAVKLCFFVLDAPPHYESQEYGDSVYDTLRSAVMNAAKLGVRIIPIVSSGSDSLTEYLMRTYAVMTGGTYTFLTDHSGIGYSHSEPDTDVQYEIEKLNEMIIRIARGYLGNE